MLSPSVVCPRYNNVSDSDYSVKLFATRSIKPVANERMIARIYALLARVKQTNDVSISWTSSHTKADTPLAKGHAAADLLVARGCGGRVSAPPNLALLVGPRPRLLSSVAPETSGGLPVKTHAYPCLTGDCPPSGVHSFCD